MTPHPQPISNIPETQAADCFMNTFYLNFKTPAVAAVKTQSPHPKAKIDGENKIVQRTFPSFPLPSLRTNAPSATSQRAFRQRKERHVNTLEDKLASLAAHSSTLASTNERLLLELQKLSTQNEILRATSSQYPTLPQHQHRSSPSPPLQQPSSYPVRKLTPTSVTNSQFVHRLHTSAATGEKLLSASQTWDLIQSIESVKKGRVDVGDVIARLKSKVTCDGSGPAFGEREIRRAVEESVGGGGDELI